MPSPQFVKFVRRVRSSHPRELKWRKALQRRPKTPTGETLSTEDRETTYRNQNRVWGAQGTSGGGMTARQRQRIRHKENAGRRG
jgi:hypothetical protein